jgi:hypothetical protein
MGSDWKGIIRVLAAEDGEALAPSDEAGEDFPPSPEVPASWELAQAES